MEINDCLHWNALIIMESNPESYKLFRRTFLLFLLIQFSVIEPEKGKTQNPLRFVEKSWCNFKWTANKRDSMEEPGNTPCHKKGKEWGWEGNVLATYNNQYILTLSIYKRNTLLTIQRTTRWKWLFSHETGFTQLTGKLHIKVQIVQNKRRCNTPTPTHSSKLYLPGSLVSSPQWRQNVSPRPTLKWGRCTLEPWPDWTDGCDLQRRDKNNDNTL